jgi:hypothetical protein
MESGSPVFAFDQFQGPVDTPYLYNPSSPYGLSSLSQTSPRMEYAMNLPNAMQDYYGSYPSQGIPQRTFTPPMSISPPLTNLSASDLSGDGMNGPATRRSRGSSTGSPSPTTPSSLVHRHPRGSQSAAMVRSAATTRKRRAKADDESDDDDDDAEFRPGSLADATEGYVSDPRAFFGI